MLATSYAAALLLAEATYFPAINTGDVARADRVAAFGFGTYWLRQAPARAALHAGLPPAITLPALARALAHNPHSADLLATRFQLELAAGQPAAATATFHRLRRLLPNSPSVKAVCGSDPACDVRFIRNSN